MVELPKGGEQVIDQATVVPRSPGFNNVNLLSEWINLTL